MSRYMSRDHAQGPDLNTIEGVVLQTYVAKLGLEVAWQDEEGRWGSRDPDTGAFNGVVGRVGRAEADVGISIISYTSERQEVVDYSHGITCHVSRVTCHVSGIGVDAMNWISKPPGKLPPSTNIVRTFDLSSWIMIGCSLAAVRWGLSWLVFSLSLSPV